MQEYFAPFTERFTATYHTAPPIFREGAIVVTLLVALVGAITYALINQEQRSYLSGLFTEQRIGKATSANLYTLRGKIVVLALVALYFSGTLVALLGVTPESNTTHYWLMVRRGALVTGGYVITTLVLYSWLWLTLFKESEWRAWVRSYLLLTFLFGIATVIPVALRLLTSLSNKYILLVAVSLLVMYKVLVVWQVLVHFPKMRRSPLHIILYLCACEIGPLLLLYRWQ